MLEVERKAKEMTWEEVYRIRSKDVWDMSETSVAGFKIFNETIRLREKRERLIDELKEIDKNISELERMP